MKQEFLNIENVTECIRNLYYDVIKNYGYDENIFGEYADESAECCALSIVKDMNKYAHFDDHKIVGNFNNISRDYEREFQKSFSDAVRKIDANEMEEKELETFQSWCLDWFFETFGTFGLKYKFGDYISAVSEELEIEN